MGRRAALILAVSQADGAEISPSSQVVQECQQLQELLSNPQIGEFDDVVLSLDSDAPEVKSMLQDLFADKDDDDFILLHIAAEIEKDSLNRPFFILARSDRNDLVRSALSVDWLSRQVARCQCPNVIILIDGPGRQPPLEKPVGEDLTLVEEAESSLPILGRALIASSLALVSPAPNLSGEAQQASASVVQLQGPGFTGAVCRGLVTGHADCDLDGIVSVQDLFGYLRKELITCQPMQMPLLHLRGSSDRLLIARNPFSVPGSRVNFDLPAEILRLLRGLHPGDRVDGVNRLKQLRWSGSDDQSIEAARALRLMIEDDSRRVSSAASAALAPRAKLRGGDAITEPRAESFKQEINLFNSEVYMNLPGPQWAGGDIVGGNQNKVQAGRDAIGAAAGTGNYAQGQETGLVTVDDVKAKLRELAEEVSAAQFDLDDKLAAMMSLDWFTKHVADAEKPVGIDEHVSTLRRVGGWVWVKFKSVMNDLPSAAVAAWLFELGSHLAG